VPTSSSDAALLPPSAPAGEPPARTGRRHALLRGLRRLLLSPCTWLVLAAIWLYGAYAVHQYRQFQVGACDLGIFYQATQGWAFHLYPAVPIKGYAQIGDHFSPIYLLLAPALWIHNSPLTIDLAQVVLVCSAAVPIYLVARRHWGILAGSLIAAAYLISLPVQGAIGFPVHEVMFGAPLIAWALERSLAGRWTTASLIMGATVFVKEDMGAMTAMFGLWALFNRKWRHALALVLWGAGMFVLTVDVIIPHFNPNGFTYANDYAGALHAHNFNGLVMAAVEHPGTVWNLLFDDPTKRQTWWLLLVPVGFICLASPIALMAAPMMVTRMLSVRNTEWSNTLYYDLPLAPIVYIAAMDSVRRIMRWTRRLLPKVVPPAGDLLRQLTPRGRRLAAGTVGTALAAGVLLSVVHFDQGRLLDNWIHKPNAYDHTATYQADAHKALRLIPRGVEVRATNNMVVPLASRDTVTLVGSHVDKGNWAIIDTRFPGCPIQASDIPPYLASLRSQGFQIVKEYGPFMVLHKV
jgi:uncharacterized membrane protein